ncbi:MAG: carotenoid biosynthesis protein [Bacteroidota bacterium]
MLRLISPTTTQGSIVILAILYTIGVIGIGWPIHPDFALLTPLNLLFSLGLILWHHRPKNVALTFFLGICYLVGFGIEWLGVETGVIFGSYQYGPVLGWKFGHTPLMIGINWVLLVYCTASTLNHLAEDWHWLVKAFLGGLVMVSLDVLIEPVAIHFDFWYWEGNIVPIRNYVMWFVIAFPLLALAHKLLGAFQNKVAFALLIMQFLFFALLGIQW